MKNLLKIIQYDMLDFIEGEEDANYSSNDVTACIKLLLEFLTTISTQEQSSDSAKAHVHELVLSLKKLNEQCKNSLIDTEQYEDIIAFIQKSLVSEDINIEGDITEQWRTL
jgi:hypothetical protein